jgi:hypothetical protein
LDININTYVVSVIINMLCRNATVKDLVEEALASGQLELEEGGTGQVRLVEIISNKILAICRPDASLDSIHSAGVRTAWCNFLCI